VVTLPPRRGGSVSGPDSTRHPSVRAGPVRLGISTASPLQRLSGGLVSHERSQVRDDLVEISAGAGGVDALVHRFLDLRDLPREAFAGLGQIQLDVSPVVDGLRPPYQTGDNKAVNQTTRVAITVEHGGALINTDHTAIRNLALEPAPGHVPRQRRQPAARW